MTDESLIEEMRSALRADRERAESRRQESHAQTHVAAPVEAPTEAHSTRVSPAPRGLLARLRRRRRHG